MVNPSVYGTVISTFDSPSTRKFSFVINKNMIVRRGQFVQLETTDGKLIGRVADVYKTNRYFMKPETVSEYESSGKEIEDLFPTSDWEYLVAEVNIMGVFGNSGFQESNVPPSPGEKVLEPESEVISRFFGFDEKGLYIGKLPYHDVDVSISLRKLFQKHLSILALSGSGKSYLTGVMIEELLDRNKELGQLAVIVIDPHGEYTSFAEDEKYITRTRVFHSDEIRIGLSEVSPYEMVSYMPELKSYAQEREFLKIMNGMRRKRKFDLNEIIQELEEKDIPSNTKDALLYLLEHLRMTGLFGVTGYPVLQELAKQGQLSVIDLSETTNMRKKQIIVAHVASALFDARRNGLIPPFLLVVEEAHQFAPEKMKKEAAVSRNIITTIAREGRKFGACLCLISQRPKQLSTTALSQCNTQIILRVTNPYDLKHIEESSEAITKDVVDRISSLKVGTGIIVGECVNFPVFVNIRSRKSKESAKGAPLDTIAVEYAKNKENKEKDAHDFMG